jgi:hypothetical protein
MTLEDVRALPWYEHDSIMEQLLDEFGEESEFDLSTTEGLRDAGFTVREVS